MSRSTPHLLIFASPKFIRTVEKNKQGNNKTQDDEEHWTGDEDKGVSDQPRQAIYRTTSIASNLASPSNPSEANNESERRRRSG